MIYRLNVRDLTIADGNRQSNSTAVARSGTGISAVFVNNIAVNTVLSDNHCFTERTNAVDCLLKQKVCLLDRVKLLLFQ